nr:hypothetical protein [Burkholderia glumae]
MPGTGEVFAGAAAASVPFSSCGSLKFAYPSTPAQTTSEAARAQPFAARAPSSLRVTSSSSQTPNTTSTPERGASAQKSKPDSPTAQIAVPTSSSA